jgi:predicted nucleotidyltransferase
VEPVPSSLERTGSHVSESLAAVLALALEWAGPSRLAVWLGGSHARGEGVWVTVDGRRVSLSDVDLYAVLPDEAACREAEARARAARPGLAARLLERGLAAPLEVAFLTPEGLARMAARPGTIELSRHAECVAGDDAWRARLPRPTAADVSREEIQLLVENRAFELLAARLSFERGDALSGLGARHATLKSALDLATVACLLAGEYPDGADARVARADALDPWPGARAELVALWAEALDWRRDPRPQGDAAAALDEWERAAHAWSLVWGALAGVQSGAGEDAWWAAARRAAARARARRRARAAVAFPTRGGLGPGAWSRWRFAARGTPQHRLNASAAVLLVARPASGDAWPEGARMTLRRLGALPLPRQVGWREAVRETLRTWDRWVLDGQRFTEAR